MSFNYSPKIVTDGLVFSFDPANTKCFVSGSTTANELKENTTLTFKYKQYNGGVSDTLTIVAPDFDTNNSGSIYFNPSSDLTGTAIYLPTGDTSTNLTTSVTLSVWFKKTSPPSWPEIIAGKGFNPGGQSYLIYIVDDTLRGLVTTTGGGTTITTNYDLNIWNNVVLTYDGSNMNLYLNGELKSTTPKTGNLSTITLPFFIACQYNGGYFPSTAPSKTGDYFSGYISYVKLYNKGLTTQEVIRNYNALKTRFGL